VPATFSVLAAAAANGGVALLLLLGFCLFGFALIPARLRPGNSAVALAASLSVGAAAAGWGGWVLGSVVGTWTLGPFWLACAVFSLRSARPFWEAFRRAGRRLLALGRAKPLLALAVVLAALPLAFPLAIPLVDNDGIRYHVALPKLYLLTGRIFLYEWDVTGAYPALGDALYLVGLVVRSHDTAKFLHAGFLLASVALLALTLHRGRRSRGAALAGPLLFLACPAVGVIAGTGFIDHIALFHLVAAFALVYRKERPALVGIALGASLATKLTVGPAAAALALAYGMGRPRGARVRALAVIAACSTVLLSPFLARNALWFGDPVFPIGYLATGRPLPGVGTEVYNHFATFNRKNAGPLGIVWTTPATGDDDETAGIHNLAGILLLFVGLRDRLVRHAALLALPFLVYAVFTSPPTRYLLPMLWGVSLAAAAVLARLRAGKGVWLAIPLALPGMFLSWEFQARNFGATDYLFGHSTREEYLARTIPGYRAAVYVNGLPPGGVMVGDFPGPVYFDRPWIVEGLINEAPLTIWIRNGESADRLLARLHENGIRWLLATPAFGGGTPLSLLTYAPDPSKAPVMAALRARLRFVTTVDGVDVWEVPAPPGSARP
jgi:hypothetical protein